MEVRVSTILFCSTALLTYSFPFGGGYDLTPITYFLFILPPVNSSTMLEFKQYHSNCVIINAFKYER